MKTNTDTMHVSVHTAKPVGFRALMVSSLVMSVLMTACSKGPAPDAATAGKPAASAPALRVVDAVEAKPLAQADAIAMNGVLAFREETRAAFKTGGVVGRIAVREGDVVKPGELLASLDASEIDAGVSQALHDKAVRDLQRGENLRAQEVIAQEVLDNLRTAEQAARASLQAAKFNRGTAELRATEALVVIKRVSEPGEVVGAGQPVLLLGSLKSGLVFRGGLSDAQRVRLNASGQASVMLDAWPGEVFDARVLEMGQAADARTGGYRVELSIKPLSGKTLLAGMVGRAQLPSQMLIQAGAGMQTNAGANVTASADAGRQQTLAKAAWVLPLSAVVETSGDTVSVYALQANDVVKLVQYPLVQLRRDTLVVAGDIQAGQRFVSSGTSYLSDGDTVRVNAVAQGAAGGAP